MTLACLRQPLVLLRKPFLEAQMLLSNFSSFSFFQRAIIFCARAYKCGGCLVVRAHLRRASSIGMGLVVLLLALLASIDGLEIRRMSSLAAAGQSEAKDKHDRHEQVRIATASLGRSEYLKIPHVQSLSLS
jgi:hypothetical protein